MRMERLINLRKTRKMSQELMSGLIGVSSRTYANWESGQSEMRASDLKKISEILKVSMDYILWEEGDEIVASSVFENLPNSFNNRSRIIGDQKLDSVESSDKIEVEVEFPDKSKIKFSVPQNMHEEKIGKLIQQITQKTEL